VIEHRLRVRYHECDPQGVVFNANYLAFADIAFTEAARVLFGGWQQVVDRGIDVVLAEATVRYLGPARFDDELAITVGATHIGTTSLILGFDMRLDSTTVNYVTNRYVWVDALTLRPTAPPDDLRNAFAAHMLVAPPPH